MRTRRIPLVLAALVAAATLTACEGDTYESESSDPVDMAEVTAPAGTPNTQVKIVTDWTKVDSVYHSAYFRTIEVAGQCFVEQYHWERGSTALAPVDDSVCAR